MNKSVINTPNAPSAIGTYSQAIKAGNLVFISGQIPFNPETMEIIQGDFHEHVRQIIRNLQAICEEAGGDLNDIVKINVYLTDMINFAVVNEVMEEYFKQPYPARAAVEVKGLPKGVDVEMEAVMSVEGVLA